jgi:hypothetical protein
MSNSPEQFQEPREVLSVANFVKTKGWRGLPIPWREIRCEADRAACDRLSGEFDLDDQFQRLLRTRNKVPA